jgi:hypothetical protein
MPISAKLTALASKPLPRFISPRTHAAIDWTKDFLRRTRRIQAGFDAFGRNQRRL